MSEKPNPSEQSASPVAASMQEVVIGDLLYAIRELAADGHIEFDEACDFAGEQFCGRYCESCGCINAKVQRARAVLKQAEAA